MEVILHVSSLEKFQHSSTCVCFGTVDILTIIRLSRYRADGGFNILLNRRRCQEAPPAPSWETWMPTPSTMWPLFPSTRTWRAYGRLRRERQVSDSWFSSRPHGRTMSATVEACVYCSRESQIIKSENTLHALCWIVCVRVQQVGPRQESIPESNLLYCDASEITKRANLHLSAASCRTEQTLTLSLTSAHFVQDLLSHFTGWNLLPRFP